MMSQTRKPFSSSSCRLFPVRCPLGSCDALVSSADLAAIGVADGDIVRWQAYELKAVLESQPDWRPCLVRANDDVIDDSVSRVQLVK